MADGKVIIATELDTKDAEKSAQGLGSKLGKGFSALGVGLATVGATATATAGKIVKSSLEAYASYEQLVGGVETLFKESSDQVKKYADEAYKTAGMSANQYMETVTSFSASLLQGLEGDTEKASKKANRAIIDMSDNANKMGTSMEMIQNAYQGFAKQNYTMLDNLKLGYGGTASEMARLVKDSGVLGEAGKDLTAKNLNEKVSFDQIVDAIHKVQDNMGITGTTSKEASTTIEGSVNSMKASWENLLTSFGDKNQDTTKKVKEFTKSVEQVLKNVLPVAEQVLKGLGETVSKLAPTFLSKVPPLIEKFLPKFISAGTGIISAILMGLAKAIPTLIKMIPKIMDVLGDAIKNALGVLSNSLPSAFKPLISVVSTIVDIFSGFIRLLTSASALGEALRTIIYGIVTAFIAYKVATEIATLYTKLLTLAMNANPVILLISAITGLIGLLVAFASGSQETAQVLTEEGKRAEETAKQYDEFSKKIKENADARKEAKENAEAEAIEIDNLYSRLKELNKVEHKNKTQREEMKSIVEQLNEKIPDLKLKYDEEKDSLNQSTKAIEKHLDAKKKQIELDAIYESAKSISKDKAETQRELNKLVQEGVRLRERESEINAEMEKWYAQQDKYYDKTTNTWNTQAKGYKEAEKHLQELSREYSDELYPALQKNADQTDDARNKLNGLNTELDQTYQQATNVQQVKVFEKLAKDAEKAGVKIPQSFKDAFEAGAITITEATDRINQAVNFSKMASKAKNASSKTVNNIISRFIAGKIDVQTAGEELAKAGVKGANSKKGDFETSGENAVKGFLKPVTSKEWKDRTYEAFSQQARWAHLGLQKGGKEGSPWKIMIPSGRYSIQGFLKGALQEKDNIEKTYSALAQTAVNSLNKELYANTQFSAGSLQSSINTSLDLKQGMYDAVKAGFENANVEMKVGERDFARLTKGALA